MNLALALVHPPPGVVHQLVPGTPGSLSSNNSVRSLLIMIARTVARDLRQAVRRIRERHVAALGIREGTAYTLRVARSHAHAPRRSAQNRRSAQDRWTSHSAAEHVSLPASTDPASELFACLKPRSTF